MVEDRRQRFAAGVEYDGRGFYGWQRQRQSPTVQESVETALSLVANHAVTVHCAGRTDTGVHARCQVIHFDTTAERTERAWVLGSNTRLHPGASLLWVRPVEESFHARFSARARRYRYRILNRWIRPALDRGRVGWVRHPLDAESMQAGGRHLLGEHDFTSFRAAGCQARSPVREVTDLTVQRCGDEVIIDIQANAFVYHMVRNIVGVLIAIGQGKRPPDWSAEVLSAKDRTQAAVTAPAYGLTFMAAYYPDHSVLPIDDESGFPAN